MQFVKAQSRTSIHIMALWFAGMLALPAGCAKGPEVTATEVGDVTIHSVIAPSWRAYVVEGATGDVLIDSGTFDETELLFDGLQQAGFPPESLSAVLITHGHSDHAGAAAAIQDLDVPILMHESDAELARAGDSGTVTPQTPTGSVFLRILDLSFPAFEPDVLFSEEANLSMWGVDARVIPVPGHTAGSVAVLLPSGVAFSGDMFGSAGEQAETHHFSEGPEADRENTQMLIDEGATRFFPAHGPEVSSDAVEAWLAQEG